MRNLQDFQVPESANIFINADHLPDFFNNNLLDPSRVVKIFKNDPQANLRVFYYQYLKLCFEVNDCDYQQYIRKIEDIINDPNFSFIFDQSEDQEVFNDMQFKQLIMEFFGLLGEGDANIETCLNHYPIIDTVFIYFFRSILILTGATDNLYSYIDRMTLFNSLVEHFNIEIVVHENCIRFTQTDIFVYEEEPQEVFMAYMENDVEKSGSKEYVSQLVSQEVIEEPIVPLKPAHVAIKPNVEAQGLIAGNPNSRRTREEGRESYIQGDFLDYTSNSPGLHTLVKTDKLKESGTIQAHHAKEAPKAQVSNYVPEPVKKAQPVIPYANAKSQYLSDIGSKSQYSQVNNSANSYLNNLLSKSPNYQASYKDQLSYTNPAWQPSNQSNLGAKTVSNYNQTNGYVPQTKPQIFTPQTSSYTPISTSNSNQFINNYTATNQYFNQYANGQASYTSYSNVKPASASFQVDPYLKVDPKKPVYNPQIQASFDVKKPTFYDSQPTLKPSSSKPSTKSPFNLNVSEEFTNSFTMKLMCQPHRSNVDSIRQRARNFRNSLKPYLK